MGFTDSHVLVMVLLEAMAIAGVGGFLGLGVGWLMISRGDPTGGLLPIFFLPTKDIVMGVICVIALGLVTGLLPALQAGRLRIADALREL